MKRVTLILILFLYSIPLIAQVDNSEINKRYNVVTTSVPFVIINPNAQSRGFGEIGVVASDCYYESGLTQNPALLSRNENLIGIKTAYTPWLNNFVDDIYLYDIGLFCSIGDKNAIGYSFKYFTIGEITFTDDQGDTMGTFRSYEYYHSLRYARTILENLKQETWPALFSYHLIGLCSLQGR